MINIKRIAVINKMPEKSKRQKIRTQERITGKPAHRKDLETIIDECVDRCRKKYLNGSLTLLYHCYDGRIDNNPFIWLSSDPDNTYGKKTAKFSVPLDELNLAGPETTIGLIRRYDIKTFQDAMYDEFVEMDLDWFDWKAYKNGKISD